MPKRQISENVEGGVQTDFRYDGVRYFRGYRLENTENLIFKYRLPWIANLGDPNLRIFIERPKEKDTHDTTAAALSVDGSGFSEPIKTEVKRKTLQNYEVKWSPTILSAGVAQFQYHGSEPIHIAVSVTRFNVWGYITIFLGVATVFFVVSRISATGISRTRVLNYSVVAGIILIAYYFHSGAFITNELFHGHLRISKLMSDVAVLMDTGFLPEQTYRRAGFYLIGILVWLLEGGDVAVSSTIATIFPTSRYLMFLMFAVSVGYLTYVFNERYGPAFSTVLGILIVTFFPFILDLYYSDADAYFVALFPFIVGLVIRIVSDTKSRTRLFICIGLLMFLFGTIKINPVFLSFVIPFSVFLIDQSTSVRRRAVRFVYGSTFLLLAFLSGGWLADTFHHPERHIGGRNVGVPFQDTEGAVWHMIWAAYGTYDQYSAHWFAKSGRLRKERVSERTELADSGYIHHSKPAAEEVYEPDVTRALSEAPNFFYSTALVRLYEDALKFYRYTFGHGQFWQEWVDKSVSGTKVVSGKEVSVVRPELEAIRYGEAWKFSQTLFLIKVTQRNISFAMDCILIVLSIIGILSFRNRGLVGFLLLVLAAQFGYLFLVHAINRYFMFCSLALIIGLGAFLVLLARAIFDRSAELSNGRPRD